ncbi:protein RIK-like [Rutidosis leptorrhynchoides]|uniref:protein RIK-like n=1 Tax=Rutidosis leptorrhynchoides TaxID=125765 RepID=UPI003A9922DA
MTEERNPKLSSDDSNSKDAASQTRQRKKRKWDQPAESLVSAGVTLPLGNVGFFGGVSLPGVVPPVSGSVLSNPLAAICANLPSVFQTSSVLQNPTPVISKVSQSKIQDELIIAREIVINDAESSVRYKLTKRQTQEEIQKCTGAVVITRGKFHPPGAPPDGEKPLYLHISAGAHLKDTAERIIAVDRAAAMVEEMLKQGHLSQPTLTTFSNGLKVFFTCVYLGFDADPSLNIVARIRGPNDQYINHIMNETGASVLLRGWDSGNSESQQGEGIHIPLHLFLSSNSSKSLEDAKRLAEHLLDTISIEFGASRVSSSKVYGAVPPPQRLMAGVEQNLNANSVAMCLTTPAVATSSLLVPSYSQPIISGGTSYSGYDGIYPQATPLQQVALALRQAPSPINSTVPPTASMGITISNSATNLNSGSSSEKEKRPPQRRKFQELPSTGKSPARTEQGMGSLKSYEQNTGLGDRIMKTIPAPKELVPSPNCMPPPPPPKFPSSAWGPPPPPPPPKFSSSSPLPPKFTSSNPSPKLDDKSNILNKARSDNVPDTLVKLMEYGDEDDDDLEETDEDVSANSHTVATQKPFWAV